MTAGKLNRRVHAQKRGDLDDGWGGVTPGAGDWETQFTISAEFRPMRGGESVIAARLTGKQPYIVRLRNSVHTRRIKHDWRLIDARPPDEWRNWLLVSGVWREGEWRTDAAWDGLSWTPVAYELRSPVHDPDGKRAWLEFVVEATEPSVGS